MYKSSYMMDYRPYDDYKPPIENHTQKIKLAEAQLKAKEFAQPSKSQPPVMYKEYPISQRKETTEGPCTQAAVSSDDKLEMGHKGCSFGPESFQEVQEEQRKYFNAVLPNADCYLSKCYPHPEQTAAQEDKAERTQMPTMPEREATSPSPFYPQHPATTEQCPGKDDQEGPVLQAKTNQTWDTISNLSWRRAEPGKQKLSRTGAWSWGLLCLGKIAAIRMGQAPTAQITKAGPESTMDVAKRRGISQKLSLKMASLTRAPGFQNKDSYKYFLAEAELAGSQRHVSSVLCRKARHTSVPWAGFSQAHSSEYSLLSLAIKTVVGARFTHNVITRARSHFDIVMRNGQFFFKRIPNLRHSLIGFPPLPPLIGTDNEIVHAEPRPGLLTHATHP
ncbi:hypothetical protein G0U57_014659 [Chelydra serpentina]|uniref:Uncharacterized protein n=1 Tax=Chelydra serpentina TaxID=8475 RepID=A0A8T1S8T8_CHESE|nr:hypothetical protein G0U57_014659 [Chelydra serpentina]